MANPSITDYITDGTHPATTGGTAGSMYIQIPCAAIGLAESDISDVGEFLNALLRTVCAKYDAAQTKPTHMTPAKSTYVPSTGPAERTYSVRLDIQYGSESVVDEA